VKTTAITNSITGIIHKTRLIIYRANGGFLLFLIDKTVRTR
jgi:hypothetical protein